MGTITRKNRKGQKTHHLGLVEVSYSTIIANRWRYERIRDKYYLKVFIENSTTKTKARKASKIARKQRKRNHK